MATYIALLHKTKTSSFGVTFPDFPGCVTGGETLEEAKRRAPEVLALHTLGMTEDGEAMPEPTALDVVMSAVEDKAAAVLVVDAPDKFEKVERYSITVRPSVMARIDAAAAAAGSNRSAFLAEAALKKITNAS
ncbi:MAG: type II toxin-antitoxin system HicB family antitoxin [Proteobacteria bacterium]|nr:type II toxin-antitoxin system HicB family antitoxin [Pseudomonadota bacterium]